MDYPGFDGFLGTRATFMLDLVFLAMFSVIPAMAWSIYLVRYRRKFELHKWIQTVLALVLLVTVLVFEVDIRLHGWRERAKESRFYGDAESWGTVDISLAIHLVFAVSTALLWIYVVPSAWRNFPRPAAPSPYSQRHILWARIAALGMLLTAVTGWIFYILAFVM